MTTPCTAPCRLRGYQHTAETSQKTVVEFLHSRSQVNAVKVASDPRRRGQAHSPAHPVIPYQGSDPLCHHMHVAFIHEEACFAVDDDLAQAAACFGYLNGSEPWAGRLRPRSRAAIVAITNMTRPTLSAVVCTKGQPQHLRLVLFGLAAQYVRTEEVVVSADAPGLKKVVSRPTSPDLTGRRSR